MMHKFTNLHNKIVYIVFKFLIKNYIDISKKTQYFQETFEYELHTLNVHLDRKTKHSTNDFKQRNRTYAFRVNKIHNRRTKYKFTFKSAHEKEQKRSKKSCYSDMS